MPPAEPTPAGTVHAEVALLGPTASGKSALARTVALLARDRGGRPVELVSVDSMAVYRGMDLGTAKPSAAERAEVPLHLVDLVDPSEEFTVQEFQAAARRALAGIAARGHVALLVGGTGLYLRSVVDDLSFPGRYPAVASRLEAELDDAGEAGGPAWMATLAGMHHRLARLDPVAAGRIEPTNRRRLVRALEVTVGSGRPFSSFGPGLERYPPTPTALVGLRIDVDELDRRIADRFTRLLDEGLVDEVQTLAARPGGLSRTARQALGYRELLGHLEDGIPLADAVERAVQRTRSLARRQMAWFRRDPRIVWLEEADDPVDSILSHLESVPTSHPGDGRLSRAP